jgi:hypothetical protein
MDKDRSIITQVAAKIAADLVDRNSGTPGKISEFATLFTDIRDIMFDSIYGDATDAPVDVETMLTNTFPGGSIESSVRVKGTQQGPLPQWLLDACARDGVTEIYDNRGDLAANPRRPWFKAVNDKEKAYWPPKGA